MLLLMRHPAVLDTWTGVPLPKVCGNMQPMEAGITVYGRFFLFCVVTLNYDT